MRGESQNDPESPSAVRVPAAVACGVGNGLGNKHREIDANKRDEVQQRGQQNVTNLRL
jgi:hypothetical protein